MPVEARARDDAVGLRIEADADDEFLSHPDRVLARLKPLPGHCLTLTGAPPPSQNKGGHHGKGRSHLLTFQSHFHGPVHVAGGYGLVPNNLVDLR